MIMKAAAEKYNGSILLKEKDGEFRVKIHLEERKLSESGSWEQKSMIGNK